MDLLQIILVGLVFLFCPDVVSLVNTTYYVVITSQEHPPYRSIYSYHPITSDSVFFANFSFHINDNMTELYYFEPGPVTMANQNSLLMYMPTECRTALCLFLFVFDMTKKTYKQSRWMLDDGDFAYLFYDPSRQHLFGLRDVSTFTLIIEEYNVTPLDVVRKYTQQDRENCAFPFGRYSVFDYEENWILEVRTRLEDLSVNAYFIKMDRNLVEKKEDIVVDFHLMPNV